MQAILFLSHLTSPAIYRTFRRLRDVRPRAYDAVWLYDAASGPPPWWVRTHPHHTYSAERLIRTGYPFMGETLTPGNAHFPIIDFRRQHDEYTHYWVVEYDVRFTGAWADFFEAFEDNEADFLSAGLAWHADAPGWVWWDALSHPSQHVPKSQRIRSFNPIYRISGEALDFIDRAHQDGWTGHFEVVLPTLLYHEGFEIEDFGGDGDFVPSHRTNQFYTSEGLNKIGPDQGTHRYQPRFWRAGDQDHMIYHPVKPISWFAKRKLRDLGRFKRFMNPLYVLRKTKEKLLHR